MKSNEKHCNHTEEPICTQESNQTPMPRIKL